MHLVSPGIFACGTPDSCTAATRCFHQSTFLENWLKAGARTPPINLPLRFGRPMAPAHRPRDHQSLDVLSSKCSLFSDTTGSSIGAALTASALSLPLGPAPDLKNSRP